MSIASKTVLVQLRFVRAGAPFVDVTTKSSIDTSDISGFVRNGNTFFGANTEITPPTYSTQAAYVRFGMQFKEQAADSGDDASYGQGWVRGGLTFVAPFSGTSSFPTVLRKPVRNGNVFNDVVAKDSINAEEFDVVRLGAPFWVRYTGAPPPFNAARFFLLF